MKILKICENNETHLIITEKKEVSIVELKREDIVDILENIYSNKEYYSDLDNCDIESIKNTVEKAMVEQIISKLCDFKKSVESIRKEISASFPPFEE